MILALLSSAVIQVTQPFPLPEFTKLCQRQPNVEACNPKPCAIKTCLTLASLLSVAQDADEQAKSNFIFDKDTSLEFRIQENTSVQWVGVCSALAGTTLELAAKRGIPENRLFRVLVRSVYDNVGPPTHAIGVLKDDYGKLWVLGDTSNLRGDRKLKLLSEMHYTVIDISRMDQGNAWIEITKNSPRPTSEQLDALFATD